MRLEEIAHSILFGERWEDKLCFDAQFVDNSHPALVDAPAFPGRPDGLRRVGKADFPKTHELAADTARGRLLHFFANHELLAMELMALMLLKFPEAPAAFRAGIARTIAEEQGHLRLYVERMQELGVGFGELPISDYFWNAMRGMKSPLQFVTQMSLTLEQANLDFSLFYFRAVESLGDERTAAILERVYREEIGHVRHGVTWFNRWREPGDDDWDAYRRLLPSPMTPRRAKGTSLFFAADSRREAGLSERFIRELEVYGGSKGRPPTLWLYNPLCDAEIARGGPGFTPSQKVWQRNLDLETLPMFAALEEDIVLVDKTPRPEWLKSLQALGIRTPEFRQLDAKVREEKLGGLEPWGWSPEPFARFRDLRERLVKVEGGNGAWCAQLLARADFAATGLGEFFAKTWSVNYLREHPGEVPLDDIGSVCRSFAQASESIRELLGQGEIALAKAPWGTSGTQNKRIMAESELAGPIGGWIRKIVEGQGAIVVERWLDKQADLSIQIEVRAQETRVLGARRFVTGAQLEYLGTELDPRLRGLNAECLRHLHGEAQALEKWRAFASGLGDRLRKDGYQGPAGLDGMIYRRKDGELCLKPLVELNPRWTMGRIALELEKLVHPASPARWLFLSKRSVDAQALAQSHPLKLEKAGGRECIREGILFTTDPLTAREIHTVLVVGAAALTAVPTAWP